MAITTETRALSGAAGLAFFANAAQAQTLDETINGLFASATGWFVNFIFAPFPGTSFPWIVAWLVVAASVFTLYFGFIQFRVVKHSIALVKGDYSDPNDAGEVSHFQALATALSGTVGLGNIAGVAVAVGIGGPGATFWMILAGLLGMASKFTECTLGVKYRNEYADGTVSGGPMYYLTKGFAERGMPGGKFLAVLFSIFCILGSFGGGNMFQANQAHQQLVWRVRRLSRLDHRRSLRHHRLRRHRRRHQVDRPGDGKGRAVHGHPLCRHGADHRADELSTVSAGPSARSSRAPLPIWVLRAVRSAR